MTEMANVDLPEVVRRADLLMHDIICEGSKKFGSQFGREMDELEQEILGEKPRHHPDANFWNLKDPFVDQAKEWINYLLQVDAARFEDNQPELYGSEILLCAEAVRKLLSKINVNIAARKRERVPLVIEELDRMIEELRSVGIATP